MMHLFKNRTTRRRAGALDPIEPAPELRPIDVAPAFELAARDLDEPAKQALAFRFVREDDLVGPSMQAARDLEMRRPTVWSMMHRIRNAMKEDGELLSGLVEMDEAFIGGKPRKGVRKDMDDDGPRDPGAKSPVVGAIARKGKVKAKVMKRSELNANVFRALVHDWMKLRETVLTTDELSSYRNLGDIIPHRMINHSSGFYSKRDETFDLGFGKTHTNTIEAFWSIVRRAIIGQFHHVSQKYLPLYMREICYRYNDRVDQCGLDGVLNLACNGRHG